MVNPVLKFNLKEAKRLRREIEILKKLEHPHIVRLVETYEDGVKLYMVMEMYGLQIANDLGSPVENFLML